MSDLNEYTITIRVRTKTPLLPRVDVKHITDMGTSLVIHTDQAASVTVEDINQDTTIIDPNEKLPPEAVS